MSMMLVEQNVRKGLAIGQRGYILENGRVAGCGCAEDLRRDPRVIESYLGSEAYPRGDRRSSER